MGLLTTALASGACGRDAPDHGPITASGTLEIVTFDVAPIAAGRVVRMLVGEGARVRRGDTVAILAQPTADAELAGKAASVSASQATLREVERGPRVQEIKQAHASLRAATAEANRTASDLERLRPLADRQIVSRQQLDAAMAAARVASDRRASARAALDLLEEGATREQVDRARAQVRSAQAALSATRAAVGDLVLTAPVTGLVLSRNAEPGEILTPAEPAVTIGDVTQPWVRVYVNEHALPFIHLGDTVYAVLDGVPNHRFAGRIVAINQRAEYTPRVALTEQERADLMFGVKIVFTDSSDALKAGLPVTVTMQRSTHHPTPSSPPNAMSRQAR